MSQYILALDQGTTSSRAIAFDRSGNIAALSQQSLPQHYPQAGWVEHDPLEIWDTQRRAAAEVIARLPEGSVAGIGVTNQRETTILWDKATGEPVYNAIVWQCRRTAELCEELKRRGLEERIRSATGLLIDAYFSGSKIRWILDNVPGVRRRAERGEVLFGTVESWLIWKLTGRHVTDYANASRTMLFDIHRLAWDEELCGILGVPTAMLPQPVPNSAVYGTVQPSIPGLESLAGVPVCGAAGDQQSALFGQTCFAPGEAKNTYGTGCFTLMNVGEKPVRSRAGLLTSVAWQVDGKTTYALEGSVFNAGSTIQWLRDELGIISSAPEIDVLAATVPDSGGVVVVPAFTGLGAPYWDMYARGAILGVTRGTGRAHIARAVLSCIAAQVTDLMLAMRQDAGCDIALLRADGGASVSDVLLQMQADLLRIPVDRPEMVETTAFGAAALAGLLVVPCRNVWGAKVLFEMLCVVGLGTALTNGIPLRVQGVANDGANARDLGKDPAALRAFWVQLSMNARQAEGVPLREMPEEWFALPDGGLDNIMLASQAVLHANRLMSEQRFAETAQCIDALLQGDTAILSLHRKLLLCDRLTCALLTGEDAAPWLVRWNSKEMKAFRKQMRSFLSVQRTEYLAALLAERDAAKAEVFHRKFEQRAKTYPYAAEAADERALVELGAQMA